MALMQFMEAMGTGGVPIIAAFFIGLMTAISPCPLATNITAIAYASKQIKHSRHTVIVGSIYTLGRMATYMAISASIIWFGLSTQSIALFLQRYGERLLGPALIIIGLIMLEVIRINIFKGSSWLDDIKKRLAHKGFLGSFLLGVLFALAFCPFSAVLFFGMLIPLAIRAGDAIFLPAVFALATGLPVIIFSFILVSGVSRLGKAMGKVAAFEVWMRRAVAIVFIFVGIYYTIRLYL